MSLQGYFQNGYVTHDLDRAIELVSSRFDLGDFRRLELELPLVTPQGPKTAGVHVAMAWSGKIQIELIKPVSGHIEHYVRELPEEPTDATPRFHHFGVLRESEEDMRRETERLDLPLVFTSAGAGVSCVFIDARSHIGHHLELMSATPEGLLALGWPAG